VADPGAFGSICPNCYTQRLAGARYCHHCGQATWDRTPTVRQMVREYGSQYVGAEGALWRTLGLLLFRPGRLTQEYLHGRRRRYLHPIRLYLTTSIVCLLLQQAISVLSQPSDQDAASARQPTDKEPPVQVDLGIGNAHLRQKDGFECDLNEWLCERLKRRYATAPERQALELRALHDRFVAFWPYAMFLLVPLFAVLLQLVYLRRRLRYAEHLVFALHLHAFWFAGLVIAVLTPDALTGLVTLLLLAYGVVAMRRVYGGWWRATLLRAALISPLYLLAMAVMVVAVVGAAALA
jgi:hypothetical protein